MGSEIKAKITLDDSGFLATAKRVDNAMLAAQRRAAAVAATFAGVTAALGTVAVAGAKVKEAFDLGSAFSDMSAKTGQAVADLVLLKRAFELAGVRVERVEQPIRDLQRRLAGLDEGGGAVAKKALDELGLSILSLQTMSAREQFSAIGAAIRQIEDPARRTKLAMDLMGETGAELLKLFMDTTALERAREQIGDMGDVLDANAGAFDAQADALAAFQTKLDQFFVGVASQMSDGGALQRMANLDLTAMGQNAGKALDGVATAMNRIMQVVQALIPLWVALGARAVRSSLVFQKVTTDLLHPLMQVRAQLAALPASTSRVAVAFTAMSATSRAALTSLVAGARAAGAAIWTAIGGPIGLITIAVTAMVTKAMGDLARLKQSTTALGRSGRTNKARLDQNTKAIRGVSNEEERATVAADLAEQLDAAREKLRQMWDDDAAKDLVEQQKQHIHLLESQQRILSNLDPAIIAANAAEKQRAAALEESKRRAAELNAELEKALRAHDAAAAQRVLEAMEPDQREQALLGRAGLADRSAFEDELRALRAMGDQREAEKQRLLELLRISEELVKIDRQRADLAARAAEETRRQAREESNQQAALAVALEDFERESRILAARATGDAVGASHLERQLSINRMTRDFESQGMAPADARQLAANRANMQWTFDQQSTQRQLTLASSTRAVGLGGNAFSNREDVQRKMATLQEQSNRYLSEQSALLRRIEAKLQTAEVFD